MMTALIDKACELFAPNSFHSRMPVLQTLIIDDAVSRQCPTVLGKANTDSMIGAGTCPDTISDARRAG